MSAYSTTQVHKRESVIFQRALQVPESEGAPLNTPIHIYIFHTEEQKNYTILFDLCRLEMKNWKLKPQFLEKMDLPGFIRKLYENNGIEYELDNVFNVKVQHKMSRATRKFILLLYRRPFYIRGHSFTACHVIHMSAVHITKTDSSSLYM